MIDPLLKNERNETGTVFQRLLSHSNEKLRLFTRLLYISEIVIPAYVCYNPVLKTVPEKGK